MLIVHEYELEPARQGGGGGAREHLLRIREHHREMKERCCSARRLLHTETFTTHVLVLPPRSKEYQRMRITTSAASRSAQRLPPPGASPQSHPTCLPCLLRAPIVPPRGRAVSPPRSVRGLSSSAAAAFLSSLVPRARDVHVSPLLQVLKNDPSPLLPHLTRQAPW